MGAASWAVGLEARRYDALQAECAGVPEHALARRVHVLGEDQHWSCRADKFFQHRPAADEFHRPQIGRAQVQEVEGVEAGRPLAIAAKSCGRWSKASEQPLDPFAQTSGLFGPTPIISLTSGYDQARGF
jgi:hypothetical protein